MNEFVCCDECFEKIGKRSTFAARVWIKLCEKHCQYQGNFAVLDDFADLRILEMMGYILTTDQKDHIKVHVKGYGLMDNETPCFCISEVQHAS